MCARYTLPGDDPRVLKLERILRDRYEGTPLLDRFRTGELAPGAIAPVRCLNRRQVPSWFLMKWGFALKGAKLIFNARSETLLEKPVFRESALHHRCLVPACAFFEWSHTSPEKEKVAFAHPQGRLVWMAGIYTLESPEPRFTVITREAAGEAARVHPRMPLILEPGKHAQWLSPQTDPRPLLTGGDTGICRL